MKPEKLQTRTPDYQRNGATTLFAALNILDGTVIGQGMDRHRQQEFISFLDTVDRQPPSGREMHVILDNYGTHKTEGVRAWLLAHANWTFHFTPNVIVVECGAGFLLRS